MHSVNPITKQEEWTRSWTVLVPCVAGIMLCAVHGYSLGVMIKPLEREFGWSRAEISGGPLIVSLIALFGGPLIGSAVDRFGPRIIALIGVPFYCAMLAALSLAGPSIFSWWALWAMLAMAAMFVTPPIWTAAVASLFTRSRGRALAIALCGSSLCASLIPPLTNAAIDAYGWRGAYMALGGVCLLLVLPAAFLFFRSGHQARTPGHAGASPLSGTSLRDGIASPAFRKLAAAVIVYSLALCALTTNAVPILIGQGLDQGTAAATAGLIGIGSLVGRLSGGFLLDRLSARKVAAVSVLIPIISVAILLSSQGSSRSAMAASLILGLSVGTEIDACAYLAVRHFGLRSFGSLFGAISGITIFANGLAPLISNAIYDFTRSYTIFVWAVIPACVAAALLFLALGTEPPEQLD